MCSDHSRASRPKNPSRFWVTRIIAVPLLLLAPGGPAARAQANPSFDEIISRLRPAEPLPELSRGVRPVGPPPSHAVLASDGSVPSVNLMVRFATGSSQLTPAATRTLDELGRALSSSSLAGYKFRIEGHTDTVGTADLNKALSEQRAKAVVDYMVNRFNIDRARLTPVGMGQDGLLVPTPPETPEPRNRRVQVVNIGT